MAGSGGLSRFLGRGPDQGVSPWVWVGLALFVLVDIALVAWALTADRTPPLPTPGAVSASQPAGDGDGADDPDAPADPAASGTPRAPLPTASALPQDLSVARPEVVLGARDTEVAYRSSTGTCPGSGAAIELTVDGGATWQPAGIAGASSVTRLEPGDGQIVDALASDPACAPTRFRSWVQGSAWLELGAQDLGWRIEGDAVVAPGGGSSTPCAALQVVPRSDSGALVLCADARVAESGDGGATWATSEPIAGLAGVAAAPDRALVLIERQNGCPGVQVAVLDGALAPGSPGQCMASDAPDGASVIAVAGDGSTLWLWTGPVVARSGDFGRTW
ncbi:hypothetical protein ACDF64_10190 [Agromyces sp. MMS24-JH15]|uniref:hypothetical protein n=1 Tax=Agromyces sp. MMS24-JH15 TaxID=3243765 RepID=UPI00374A8A1D